MNKKSTKLLDGNTPDRIKAWTAFAERLRSVISQLKEDHALVIQEKGTNRFVQVVNQGEHGLRAEATSNAYLSGLDQLSPAQIEALCELGWMPPTGTPSQATPEMQPEGSPNFMTQFSAPVDTDAVASLAIATLADVVRVPHPGFLCYQGINIDTGDSMVWSELGLKIAEGRNSIADAALQMCETLRTLTGDPSLDFDEDGDIAFRFGSAAIFVKLSANPISIRIRSALLMGVHQSPELFERLNELNHRIVRPALYCIGDSVVAEADIPAEPFQAQHLVQALSEFCSLADGIDELLQSEFGGRTAFTETMVSTKVH